MVHRVPANIHMETTPSAHSGRFVKPSDEQLAEAEARAIAREADPFGALLGDPPPGFSALDRRRSA